MTMITLDNVQDYAAERIESSPLLSAFGDAFIYSPHDDDETRQREIAERTRSSGVSIEIGDVTAPSGGGTIGGIIVPILAEFTVFAEEKIGGTHTPRDRALVAEIIRAICSINDPYQQTVDLAGYGSGVSERGCLVHVITFSIRCEIGETSTT